MAKRVECTLGTASRFFAAVPSTMFGRARLPATLTREDAEAGLDRALARYPHVGRHLSETGGLEGPVVPREQMLLWIEEGAPPEHPATGSGPPFRVTFWKTEGEVVCDWSIDHTYADALLASRLLTLVASPEPLGVERHPRDNPRGARRVSLPTLVYETCVAFCCALWWALVACWRGRAHVVREDPRVIPLEPIATAAVRRASDGSVSAAAAAILSRTHQLYDPSGSPAILTVPVLLDGVRHWETTHTAVAVGGLCMSASGEARSQLEYFNTAFRRARETPAAGAALAVLSTLPTSLLAAGGRAVCHGCDYVMSSLPLRAVKGYEISHVGASNSWNRGGMTLVRTDDEARPFLSYCPSTLDGERFAECWARAKSDVLGS